ncbi:glycine betaine ABC transporter substrate-binding protein [Alicyclobacillus sp.]|uniref:glycine betaine ABC transporter substrate-binding protein n=1 Tax=Alicyclobacillus sp. TaxID=61169 RepID=UPI0025BB8DFF|nr:glycine betaine ABC transporter substrate-binding protein [Alicyclobacillus sp.]MCL6517487.1 glycine betaine ABC transporter substrate-binding protein [Alicyclobacillus sp.]
MRIRQLGMVLSFVGLMGVLVAGCGQGTSGGHAADENKAGQDTTAQGGAGDQTVHIGYVNWAEDVAVSNLWKAILEDKGYQVQLTALDAGPLFVGLSQGGLDVFLDTWLPYTHKNYMDRYGSQLEDLGQWYQGQAKIGLVVPKSVDVSSIDQLNAHASEFHGQIVGIDAGAGEMQVAKKALDAYGLKLNLVSGSEASMLSALQRAETNHQPIVVTLWSPHWAFAKWDLKYLDDPKGIFGKAEEIHAEANKQWAQSHPELVKWFSNFKLTDQQLGELEMDVNQSDDKLAGARKWMEDHRDLVNQWPS